METIEKMLVRNDFEELAKGIRMPENRTFTRVMIDLSDGEVWLCVEGPGEEKYYRSETIIPIMAQKRTPSAFRTARVIENRARKALLMYYQDHKNPSDIIDIIYNDYWFDDSMPKNTILPLGSIVRLERASKCIMICGRAQKRECDGVSFDYTACYYPEGVITGKEPFYFNHEDIEEVYYYGYSDNDEKTFAEYLQEDKQNDQ